jgi:hypothetical protein
MLFHGSPMFLCYFQGAVVIAEPINPVNYVSTLIPYHVFMLLLINAYTLSEHLLIPYCRVEKNDKSKDVCSFYISQLRIHIEQAFGLLVSKWRIFKKPIDLKLYRVQRVVFACSQLHNFCIHERDDECPVIFGHYPDAFVPNYEFALPPVQTLLPIRTQQSSVREAIHAQLQANGIEWPQYNIINNHT